MADFNRPFQRRQQLRFLGVLQHRAPVGQHDLAEEGAFERQDARLDSHHLTLDPVAQDAAHADLGLLQRLLLVLIASGPRAMRVGVLLQPCRRVAAIAGLGSHVAAAVQQELFE